MKAFVELCPPNQNEQKKGNPFFQFSWHKDFRCQSRLPHRLQMRETAEMEHPRNLSKIPHLRMASNKCLLPLGF